MTSAARGFVLVLLVALVARVGAALWLGIDGPPRGDERGYALLAESLAAGEGLRLPIPENVRAAAGVPEHPALRAFRGPLVPAALAPVAALGGGLVAMRLALLVVGALAPPLLLLAARPLVGARAALWAGLAYALWPPHLHVSAHALSEPLSMSLLVPAAALIGRARRTDGSGPRAALGAALAGLSVLARPAALLPAAALASTAGNRRRVALAAAALALVLAPWVVRNQVVLGRPLVTTNSGVTLVGGNSAAAAEAEPAGKWLPPEEVYALREDGPDLGMWGWSALGEEESDRRFTADAFDWAADHPGAALRLAGRKLARLFDPDPRSRRDDAPLKAVLGWLTLTPVLGLALVGLGAVRREPGAWAPWLALVAGTVVTALVFYGDTRMRAAADPTLLLLAAAGARRLLPGPGSGS